MKDEKILSVVVPTYNMEAYLDRCLSSFVLSEEYVSALEVIVVNDGSRDGSSSIAHRYASDYPGTFIAVDKENGNYGSCVNKGLELASGKYFRILDADDWFNKEALMSVISALKECDADLVFTKYAIHYSHCDALSVFPDEVIPGRKYQVDELDDRLINQVVVRMHGMTFRTELLRKCGLRLQHGISYTDSEYCYYPSKSVKSVVFLDEVLYEYDNSRDGQTMDINVRTRSLGQMHKVLMPLLKDYSATGIDVNPIALAAAKNILFLLYNTSLLICRKNAEVERMLREADAVVVKKKELVDYLDSLKVRKVHYVSLWRKTGLYYTDPVFRPYNFVWDTMKKLFR